MLARKMRVAMMNAFLCLLATPSLSFAPSSSTFGLTNRLSTTFLYSSAMTTELLSVSLEKPLGMILEEVEEGAPLGVKVEELADSGSAYASEYRDQLVGLKLSTVMGEDVTAIGFDDIMDKIIGAPSPISIDFEVEVSVEQAGGGEQSSEPSFDVGTSVIINVIQEGKPDQAIEAKVGDNLRTTLLENNVELYRGLKKKLGNCGGGGQVSTHVKCDTCEMPCGILKMWQMVEGCSCLLSSTVLIC